MSLYDETVMPALRFLDNVDKWLDAGVEHAKKKGVELGKVQFIGPIDIKPM